MLKGKSTIQLFDAGSGKKTAEYTDNNMLTNAVNMMLSLKDPLGVLHRMSSGIFHYSNMTQCCGVQYVPEYDMLPLYKKTLAGLYLLDSNIEEDPTIIYPPAGVHEVGHAGAEYSGTNPKRGSFNTNESGEIDGGYRLVWDFNTDKANGTIKCLSLTSYDAGNYGFEDLQSTHNTDKIAYPYNSGFVSLPQDRDNVYDQTIGFGAAYMEIFGGTSGATFYAERLGDGTIFTLRYCNGGEIRKVVLSNPEYVGATCSGMVALSDELLFTVTPYSAVYICENAIQVLSFERGLYKLTHKSYSLTNYQLINTRTVVFPKTVTSVCNTYCSGELLQTSVIVRYFNNAYYAVNKVDNVSRLAKFDMDGNFIKNIATVNIAFASTYIDEFTNRMIFAYGVFRDVDMLTSANGLAYIDGDDRFISETQGISTSAHPYVQNKPETTSAFIKTNTERNPFILYSLNRDNYSPTWSSGYTKPMSANTILTKMLKNSYLATINNLATPITKTSAQTMKITYEIYDE